MQQEMQSIRPFIGAKNFEVSRQFYAEIGFEESVLAPKFSVFKSQQIAFYLQDYYAKEWVDNTMVFVEVANVKAHYDWLLSLDLSQKFEGAKLVAPREMDWGRECFLHDPSGILWHFGSFSKS